MNLQRTLIIVKPDGIEKGLVGSILTLIHNHNLNVVSSLQIQLQKEMVEKLYEKEMEMDKKLFEEITTWISSSPVLLLIVEGNDAINTVKFNIIGKYPKGLRGKFSENKLKNIAHAPDSIKSAHHELELLTPLFERKKEMDRKRLDGKMIFALTGMSECGKSSVGKYFDNHGIPRLKIIKLFKSIYYKWNSNMDFRGFVEHEEKTNPLRIWDAFIDELLIEMEKRNVKTVSIESLYGGGLGPYLKQKLGKYFCIIYIDVPLKIRLRRQMQREQLTTIKEAKKHLLPRDNIKTKSGVLALKEIAGEIVDNSDTLVDLHKAIDSIIAKYAF